MRNCFSGSVLMAAFALHPLPVLADADRTAPDCSPQALMTPVCSPHGEAEPTGPTGLALRSSLAHPYCDLDPGFERADGAPVVWRGVAVEKKELEAMGTASRKTVCARLDARKKWFEQYQALSSSSADACDKAKNDGSRANCKVYQRNWPDNPHQKQPILSGRAVHFKNLGCFLAEVEVTPPDGVGRNVKGDEVSLKQGVFKEARRYQAVVRYSNGSGRFVSDRELSSNGMAVKLLSAERGYDFGDHSSDNADRINAETVLNMANINADSTFMFNPPQYRRIIEKFGLVLDLDDDGEPLPNNDKEYKKLTAKVLAGEILLGNEDTAVDLRTLTLVTASKGHHLMNPLYQDYNSFSAFRLGEPGDGTAVKYLFEQTECDNGVKDDALEAIHNPDWARQIYPPVDIQVKDLVGKLKRRLTNLISTDRLELTGNKMADDAYAKMATPEQQKRVVGKDFLKANAEEVLKTQPVCYDWKIHPFKDLQNTPVDDATVTWFVSKDHKARVEKKWQKFGEQSHICTAVQALEDLMAGPTVGLRKLALEALRKKLHGIPMGGEAYKTAVENLQKAEHCLAASVSDPAPMSDRKPAKAFSVGEIKLLKLGDNTVIDDQLCEQLSFNVWDQVPVVHKPLGRVNRMRWYAYRASLNARKAGVPVSSGR